MAQGVVQDYIGLVMGMDRAGFLQRASTPILIAEAPKAGLTFSQGQTRLTRERKKSPLSRDLIRNGNMLPVFEVRQNTPGPPGQVRLGRSDENDLVLRDDSVSSRHAVFQRDERTGTYMLQDLASMNGTMVNGSRLVVGKPVVIFDGDVLSFGDSSFLFFYPGGLYDVIKANLEDT